MSAFGLRRRKATPSASMSALAGRATEAERDARQQTRTGITTLEPTLEGRVFHRLRQYGLLPPELRAQTDALVGYLSAPTTCACVFNQRPWWWRLAHRKVIGPVITGNELLETILDFLDQSQPEAPSLGAAHLLSEALVLAGFISPVKEPHEDAETYLNRYVRDREYYELVCAGAWRAWALHEGIVPSAASSPTSVWSVADGSTRAGWIFERPPPTPPRRICSALALCSPHGRERPLYAVINKSHHQALFLFASDTARSALGRVPLRGALVAYALGTEDEPLCHGLELTHREGITILDFVSRTRQEEWLLTILDAGAKYIEIHPRHRDFVARGPSTTSSVASTSSRPSSFFDLCDRELVTGERVPMSRFRGHVILLVNVASRDPEALLQFPELEDLWTKYRNRGLVVLACPCRQFLDLEFAEDAQIREHLQQMYGLDFPVLACGDVQGPEARELFLFVNARLPGALGPFVEWNFTKFLIDREGQPRKRFETATLPLAMEKEILSLLHGGGEDSSTEEEQER